MGTRAGGSRKYTTLAVGTEREVVTSGKRLGEIAWRRLFRRVGDGRAVAVCHERASIKYR